MSAASFIEQADTVLRRDGQGLTLGQRRALEAALGAVLARDVSALQRSLGAWQRQTFGDGDPALAVQGMQKKLDKEAHELMLELIGTRYRSSAAVGRELADCLILLLGMAERLGLDCYEEIVAKMAVNRARKWPALAAQIPGQPVQHLSE